MLNMWQISSLMAATDGPVAEFSSFANFVERKRKSNLLISFPKIVHRKGSFGQQSRTTAYAIRNTVNRLPRKELYLNPVVLERSNED